MKTIELTKNKVALISDCDFEAIKQFKWSCSGSGKLFYARTWTQENGHFLMHRFIMRAAKGQLVDHINGNTLDNRRENLRFCDKSQNAANGSHKRNKFGLKGVFKNKGKFAANVQSKGKIYYSGNHSTPEEAGKAYDRMAIAIFGEFAQLNFPSSATSK